MTVVNPKSISGINSITMASGSDNLLTIHSNNTTERVRVNSSGDVIVGSGVTLSPDGDAFFTGVCTATSFVGSGANLTSLPSQVTISNNGDDRIITGGSGTNLSGEGNFTFDGTTVKILNTVPKIELNDGSSRILQVRGGSTSHNPSIVTQYDSELYLGANNTESVNIGTEHLTITNGDLKIGTAGHGIDFSAQTASSASGATTGSEVLDHYEEGTFTPTILASSSNPSMSYTSQSGRYTKIGNQVCVAIDVRWSGRSGGGGNARLGGLPFQSNTTSHPYSGAVIIEKNKITTHADEAIMSVEVGSSASFGSFLSTVHDSSDSTSGLTIGNFQDTSGYLMVSFFYFTN